MTKFETRGRPVSHESGRKVTVSMKVNPALLARMRATGKGWHACAEQAMEIMFPEK